MKPQLREGLHAFSSFWLCYRKYTTTSPVFVYAHLQVGDTSASYPYNSCILCLAMCDDFSSCPFRILMLFSIHTEDTNAYAIVLKIKEEKNYRPHLHSNTIWHDAINSHRRNGEEQKKKKKYAKMHLIGNNDAGLYEYVRRTCNFGEQWLKVHIQFNWWGQNSGTNWRSIMITNGSETFYSRQFFMALPPCVCRHCLSFY